MLFNKDPQIEFLCSEDDWKVIPEPYKANKLMPDWYKHLPMKLGPGLNQSTIKRCNPFLDAMSAGWIIPLCADVEISTDENGLNVHYEWDYHKPLIENHNINQISSEKGPNPTGGKPPMKWMNYWAIKVPKGYSVLFVPPLNRTDPRFTVLSGFVDCDQYFEYVNFPFTFDVPNFHGIIPAGTPLVQAIPIKRDSMISKSNIGCFTEKDIKELQLTRSKRSSRPSLYRDELWKRKS